MVLGNINFKTFQKLEVACLLCPQTGDLQKYYIISLKIYHWRSSVLQKLKPTGNDRLESHLLELNLPPINQKQTKNWCQIQNLLTGFLLFPVGLFFKGLEAFYL